MISYDYLHEIECVDFRSHCRRPVPDLFSLFWDLGFTAHYDIVTLDRCGVVPPWQSTSIVTIDVYCANEVVYGFDDGEWDAIRLKYLFATLPFEFTETFLGIASRVSRDLKLPMEKDGSAVDERILRSKFTEFREDLLLRTRSQPGSEALAMLIHSTYPRD